MKKETPMEILKVFDSTFYSNYANNYSLGELATNFGISLTRHEDFLNLYKEISRQFFKELFNHEPFLNLPILGMCQDEEATFYIFESTKVGRCLRHKIDIFTYTGIVVGHDNSIAIKCLTVPQHCIETAKPKTVRDLVKILLPIE